MPFSLHWVKPVFKILFIGFVMLETVLSSISLSQSKFVPLLDSVNHCRLVLVHHCVLFLFLIWRSWKALENKVGCPSMVKWTMRFEPPTFWFAIQCLIFLCRSPLHQKYLLSDPVKLYVIANCMENVSQWIAFTLVPLT